MANAAFCKARARCAVEKARPALNAEAAGFFGGIIKKMFEPARNLLT
ncbi:MAG: hypothetical protein WBO55_18920 [Rhizobiaceae bacterium]